MRVCAARLLMGVAVSCCCTLVSMAAMTCHEAGQQAHNSKKGQQAHNSKGRHECGDMDVPQMAKGTFVQRKILADVEVTLVSKGEFRFEKGKFFEWKVASPVPSVFYATPTNWSVTVRGKTTVHPLNVDVSSFDRIFEIKEMRGYVEKVELEPKKGFPNKVNVKFKNGDRLEIDMVQSR